MHFVLAKGMKTEVTWAFPGPGVKNRVPSPLSLHPCLLVAQGESGDTEPQAEGAWVPK